MVPLGLALTAAAASYLLFQYSRSPKAHSYPAYGLAGLLIIGLAEVLLYLDIPPVPVYFTPIAWTGYILAVDAAVFSLQGRSLLRTEPQALVWMAVLSIFLWCGFELYNIRLVNWTYVGLPRNEYLRYLGYGWSFATIWPAVLETAELLLATRFRDGRPAPATTAPAAAGPLGLQRPERKTTLRRSVAGWVMLGTLLVTVPLLVPRDWGVYLFGSVWLGYIFLVDPLNYRAERPSIWGDLAVGRRSRLWALLLAGGICGVLWEFWNYWATAKWFYIFPILENWRVFEMPLPGYLGFPAFAVEIFALYVFAAALLRLPFYETR